MNHPFVKYVYSDIDSLSRGAAEAITRLAQTRVRASGRFTVALSGGSTPRSTYSLLAVEPLAREMPWAKTRIYFGDERHVPHDHPDSNFRMANEALLQRVPIPVENVNPIPTDHEDPAACAEWYDDLLHAHFQRRTDDLPGFDLILLGIGPDGHIASIFAGTPAETEMQKWVTWCDPVLTNPAIKPAVKRITITQAIIWRSAQVFVLATGGQKAMNLAKIFADAEPPKPPVARLLRECKGTVSFFLDNAAAALI
ncbi:MAG TPA: 6-phosphogluconolactonase [Planctomycetota bacterium]|jgi:6-phosphogluconolactonase